MAPFKILFIAVLASVTACRGGITDPPRNRALELIEALGDPDPEVREAAQADLTRIAGPAEEALEAHAADPDPEVAARCREILRETEKERLAHRAVPVGQVCYVEPQLKFLLLGAGRETGLVGGQRFVIRRGEMTVGWAEFEKYLGDGQLMSKLRILEADAGGIRPDDWVSLLPLPRGPAPAQAGGLRPAVPAVAPPRAFSGKVALVDLGARRVAVDLRQRNGVQEGDVLVIRSDGRPIGRLVVTEVQAWGSWAVPLGETRMEDLQKGDGVESPPKKEPAREGDPR